MKKLEGKVAIVTGSGQGIGRGIAVYLARQGVKVVTNNRKPGSGTLTKFRKEDVPKEDWDKMIELLGDAESTAELIRSEGGEATPFYGDVSDWSTAGRMVNFAIETYGSIDIIVNNAAGTGSGSVLNTTEEKWDLLTSTKQKGSFNLMHFAAPHMIKNGYGRILNASSEAWTGIPDNVAYCVANAGVVGLTWAAAKELWRYGITVNAFCPQGASPSHAVEYAAMVRNVKNITGKEPDLKILKVVEENHGDPIGIGPVLAFLCTSEGAHISGSVFSIYASGVVRHYANPVTTKEISKGSGDLWTLDELETAFRDELLGEKYVAPGSVRMW